MSNQTRIAELVADYSTWTDDQLTRELPAWDKERDEYAAIVAVLEQRKREREAQAEAVAAERHKEALALDHEALRESRRANHLSEQSNAIASDSRRMAVFALWIGVAGLLLAVGIPLLQWLLSEPKTRSGQVEPTLAEPAQGKAPADVPPATNVLTTTPADQTAQTKPLAPEPAANTPAPTPQGPTPKAE